MDTGPPAAESLLKASMHLLRPLVRLLLRAGVTFPVFSDRLRVLFVETAVAGLEADQQARTDSRVSLLTGVHRKEIRRLRESERAPLQEPAVMTLATEIIARWLALQQEGEGLVLPRSAEVGPSFEGIVRSVTNDIRPRAVLDEWVRQGIVRLEGEDRVRLTTTAYIPRPGSEAQLFYFGRNLHDHIAAAAANVAAAGTAPYPDLSVHYDHLTLPTAAVLEAAARAAAETLMLDINSIAARLVDEQANDTGSDTAKRRVNLGVYLFVEDEPVAGADR